MPLPDAPTVNQPHVRFLWRLDLIRLRRLCLEILRALFFLRFPIIKALDQSVLIKIRCVLQLNCVKMQLRATKIAIYGVE